MKSAEWIAEFGKDWAEHMAKNRNCSFNMHMGYERGECGTVACQAGWLVALRGNLRQLSYYPDPGDTLTVANWYSVQDQALKILEVPDSLRDVVTCAFYQEHWSPNAQEALWNARLDGKDDTLIAIGELQRVMAEARAKESQNE